MRETILISLLLLITLPSCKEESGRQRAPSPVASESSAVPEELPSPAEAGSGEPHLSTTADGRVIMSWLEGNKETREYALRFATLEGAKWSAPRLIAARTDFFVNWADFPSITPGPEGTLFAHWLQRSGKDPYAYDVRLSISPDGGSTWSPSVVPHTDGTRTEHGFVSLAAGPNDSVVSAVWLDGRNMKEGSEHAGSMSIRYAAIDPKGQIHKEAVLDDRVCECCQTSMALTSAGPVIVYRDRSEQEVRDIAIVRWTEDGWTEPRVLGADGWKIDGCPVNGPQIDARGSRVALAWYSGAKDKGHVYVAFSNDSGATFGASYPVDEGAPVGRVDVNLLADGSAHVTWIEQAGAESAEIRTRRVRPDGTLGRSLKVAASSPARAAGFPRTALAGDHLYFAWTEVGEPARVRVSRVRI